MTTHSLSPSDFQPIAIIVQQGKVLDFIDGQTQREETPEEYVRQEIAKSLARLYPLVVQHRTFSSCPSPTRFEGMGKQAW